MNLNVKFVTPNKEETMNESEYANILLVEDNYDHIIITEKILKRVDSNCNIQVLTDGKSVINYIQKEREHIPDFTLLDFNLPDTSGIDVLKAFCKDNLWSQIPIWMIGTLVDEFQLKEANRLGISGFFEKPIDRNGMDSVKKIFARSQRKG